MNKEQGARSSDPTADEMRECLKEQGFTEDWDVEPAIYWFANDYHGGQSSNLYSALSTSDYQPGRLMGDVGCEGEGAEAAYERLVDQYASIPARDQ